MSEQFDEKLEQFERLWEGVTPNGINRQKSLKFQQYMRQHVLQKFHKKTNDQFASADKATSTITLLQRTIPNKREL